MTDHFTKPIILRSSPNTQRCSGEQSSEFPPAPQYTMSKNILDKAKSCYSSFNSRSSILIMSNSSLDMNFQVSL